MDLNANKNECITKEYNDGCCYPPAKVSVSCRVFDPMRSQVILCMVGCSGRRFRHTFFH